MIRNEFFRGIRCPYITNATPNKRHDGLNIARGAHAVDESVLKTEINVFITSLLCLLFIFLPSFLLVVGILPIWQELKKMDIFVRAFKGINAGVIGLLVAAFYNPIILSSLSGLEDIILILIACVVLFFTKIPQWLAVFILSLSGWVLSLLLT